jgi:serine protease containing a PDZ domain, putative
MKSVTRILITALVLTGIGFIPLPYELETVRPALNAKDFVQVQGGTDKGKGKIYVMAVGVSKARVFSLFLTLLPNYRLETEYVSVPENYFDKEKGTGRAREQHYGVFSSQCLAGSLSSSWSYC